jgi:hypothetical protein
LLLLLVRDSLGGCAGALAADGAGFVSPLVRLEQLGLVKVFEAARAIVLERVLAVDMFSGAGVRGLSIAMAERTTRLT